MGSCSDRIFSKTRDVLGSTGTVFVEPTRSRQTEGLPKSVWETDIDDGLHSEKVEVYHLGSFRFYVLTGGGWPYSLNSTPREFRHRPLSLKVKTFILAGTQPTLPLEIEERNNTAVMGIVHEKGLYIQSKNATE